MTRGILNFLILLFSVPLGSIPELPAETCKEIKASEGHAVSKKYWLSTIKPWKSLLVYCDMKTEGEVISKIKCVAICSFGSGG